jgi:hypothetical protein
LKEVSNQENSSTQNIGADEEGVNKESTQEKFDNTSDASVEDENEMPDNSAVEDEN